MCGRWQAGGDGDYAADETDEDAEETALEGYETVVDKVDSPVHECQMFRGTLLSKFFLQGGPKNTDCSLKVCNSHICWHRIAFYISNRSVFYPE